MGLRQPLLKIEPEKPAPERQDRDRNGYRDGHHRPPPFELPADRYKDRNPACPGPSRDGRLIDPSPRPQERRLLYRFLDAGSPETFRMDSRPASKKRRGTKSREGWG